MHFDNVLQNAFVLSGDGHGEALLYRRASKCPCSMVGDANRALLSCAACKGIGWIYATPIPTIAIITGIRNEKQLLDTGIAEPGDLLMGCAPGQNVFITDWDTIQMTWPQGQPYDGETIKHGASPTDILSYDPIKVLECFTVDPDSGVITPYQGDDPDFTISGREITWNIPMAEGTVYSIKYTTNYIWVAFVTPTDRYDMGLNIGQKVLLRKRHLALQTS